MNSPLSEHDLEQLVRERLARHAAEAPTELPGGIPVRGRAATRPEQRRRGWLVPAAAALVAMAIPVAYLATRHSDPAPPVGPSASEVSRPSPTSPGPEPLPTATGAAARPSGIPTDWRPESYAGVQVWVPPSWGWGTTPLAMEGGTFLCGNTQAMTVPGSSDFEFVPEKTPYVGRPVPLSDACAGGEIPHPTVDAIWLGAAGVSDGTQAFPDGVVRTTRTIGGSTVTVFGTDAALARQLLAGAQAVGVLDANGCPLAPPDPVHDSAWPTGLVPTSMSICTYGHDGARLWSGRVGEGPARAYAAAAGPGAAGAKEGRASDWSGEEKVFLLLNAVSGQDQQQVRVDVYSPRLGILSPAGGATVLTPASPANTEPWAKNSGGVKAYVVGGADIDPDLARFFRGMFA